MPHGGPPKAGAGRILLRGGPLLTASFRSAGCRPRPGPWNQRRVPHRPRRSSTSSCRTTGATSRWSSGSRSGSATGGLEPWLDIWHLTPGGRWQEELAEGLAASRACAVFIGPHDLGDWELQELARGARPRGEGPRLPALPGAASRAGRAVRPERPAAVPRHADVGRLPRGRGTSRDGSRRSSTRCKACRRGRRARWPAPTTGRPTAASRPSTRSTPTSSSAAKAMSSGCSRSSRPRASWPCSGRPAAGKSSLVRAGLLPALRRGALPGERDLADRLLRPGARPLTALAAQLARRRPRRRDAAHARRACRRRADAAPRRGAHARRHGAVGAGRLGRRPARGGCSRSRRDETERARFLANLVYAASVPDGQAVVVTDDARRLLPARCAAYPEAGTADRRAPVARRAARRGGAAAGDRGAGAPRRPRARGGARRHDPRGRRAPAGRAAAARARAARALAPPPGDDADARGVPRDGRRRRCARAARGRRLRLVHAGAARGRAANVPAPHAAGRGHGGHAAARAARRARVEPCRQRRGGRRRARARRRADADDGRRRRRTSSGSTSRTRR